MKMTLMMSVMLVACSGKDASEDSDTGAAASGGATFDNYIFVDQEPSGNFEGFAGFDAEGAWLTQDVDASLQTEVPLTGQVLDFQYVCEGDRNGRI